MTNEEKTLLIAYLVEAGELSPEGDAEAHVPRQLLLPNRIPYCR